MVAAAPDLLLTGRAAAAQGPVLNDASGLNPTPAAVSVAIGTGLHARPEPLRRAYPEADAFAAAKRRFAPGLLFRNALWDRYLA